jgi:pimeloyl-ACP methyl ester carboxylesterase
MPSLKMEDFSLEYLVQGEGEPLLLLPGLGTGMGYYRFGEPELRRHFKTILVDPRGIGASRSSQTTFSAEEWADDFAELVGSLGIPTLHVLGSSHGGCMAMAMAERHPDLVASLVLVGGFSELDELMRRNFDLRIALVDRLGMSDELGVFITMWIMSHAYLDTEAGRAQGDLTIQLVKKNDPEVYKALCRSILDWGKCLPGQEGEPKFTERLRGLDVPALALTGDDDQFIPARMSRVIADALPGCSYAEIAGCGHIPFMERPSEASAAVIDFLGRHPIAA